MKKLLCILLALVLVFSFAACSSSDNDSNKDTDDKSNADDSNATTDGESYKIGVSMYAKEFTSEIVESLMNQHAEDYMAETGNKVEIVYTYCDYDVATQISDVESLITMGCDAIAVRVTDTEGCNVCFDACKDAGIPSVAMWNGGEGADITIFAVDNYVIGQRQAEWFIDYAKETGETYICGYLDGISSAADTLLRCSGFKDTIKEEYGDLTSGAIQVIAEQYSENSADTSQKVTEDWLISYPQMNTVIGWNDTAAYGATQAFIAAGYTPDQYTIIGCDGTDYNDLLEDGTWEMTIGITFAPNVQQLWDVMIALCEGDMDTAQERGSQTADSYFAITKETRAEWNELAGIE